MVHWLEHRKAAEQPSEPIVLFSSRARDDFLLYQCGREEAIGRQQAGTTQGIRREYAGTMQVMECRQR